MSACGPSGAWVCRFEDGLRFLATALALQADQRNHAATLSAACDAVKCFLALFERAADRHLPDPGGEIQTLKAQCIALLTLHQTPQDAAHHAIEAARLARDQAARLLPKLGV